MNQPGIVVQLLTAGSAACVADLITFPLDTAKVRSVSCVILKTIFYLKGTLNTALYNFRPKINKSDLDIHLIGILKSIYQMWKFI